MSKPQAVSRFVRGLNPPLNHRLESMRPESLQDAVLRAKPLEEEIKNSSSFCKQPPPFKSSPRPNPNIANPGVTQSPKPNTFSQDMAWKNGLCYNCYESGHRRAQCPHPPRAARPFKAPNPNFIPQGPRGRAALINPPPNQSVRSYGKGGHFNSKGQGSG